MDGCRFRGVRELQIPLPTWLIVGITRFGPAATTTDFCWASELQTKLFQERCRQCSRVVHQPRLLMTVGSTADRHAESDQQSRKQESQCEAFQFAHGHPREENLFNEPREVHPVLSVSTAWNSGYREDVGLGTVEES